MEIKDDTRKVICETERIVINDKITIIDVKRDYGNGMRKRCLHIRGQDFQKLKVIENNEKDICILL
jgi:hypothetical protein